MLDTCVLPELRSSSGHAGVRAAVDALDDDDLYLSVVTIGEIQKGIALLSKSRRRAELEQWLIGLETGFSDRILRVDLTTAKHWGDATASCQRAGTPLPAADGLIAATAVQHGLAVMTRNARHFRQTGVQVLDPWAD